MFSLYEHSLDLRTGDARLQIGSEELAGEPTDGLDSLVIENARLDEIAEENAAELERISRDKSRILGVVAHDLRNPLTAILGQSELLRAQVDAAATDDCDFRQMAQHSVPAILESTRRLVGMIDTLLSQQAIQSGSITITKAPCDLRDSAREAIALSLAHAGAKRIELRLMAPAPIVVPADARRLVEVLDNLVSNAVKFSHPDTKVVVEVSGDSTAGHIAVRDEGPGLSEEDLSKLFEPFQRPSARPTTGETSTGLGLSISRDLALRMGGRIWAQSSPGEGATFNVELPA